MKKKLFLLAILAFSRYVSFAQTLQTVTDIDSNTTHMIGVPAIKSNNSTASLTLMGGANGANSLRGGQINLYAGGNTTVPGGITFHSGLGGLGAEQPERMRLGADGIFNVNGRIQTADCIRVYGTWTNTVKTGIQLANTALNRGFNFQLSGTANPGLALWGTNASGAWVECVRIDSAGDMGIGTNAPGYKLDVAGHTRARGFVASDLGPGNASFQLRNATGVIRWGIGGAVAESGSNAGYNYTIYRYNDAGALMASSGDFVIQRTNGYVGIGTAGPQGALHITSTTNPSVYITSPNPTLSTTAAAIRGNNSTWLFGYSGASGAEDISIGARDNTGTRTLILAAGGAERMKINADGTVGIGTSDTKGYKLAVNGSAVFTKVVVKNNANWPDYVFDSAYQLAPLHQVENYIQQHKHLPDMPSATAVKKEGVNLEDNQTLLLKKIEELTLYIIDQNKKLEAQQEKLNVQQQQMEEQGKQIKVLQQKVK